MGKQEQGLVAQCSAIGVSVAATPPSSAIRFGRKLFCDTSGGTSRSTPPLQSYVFSPSLQNTPNTTATGGGENRCDTVFWGGCSAAFLRHL